jgi:hypothetical protein
MRLWQARHGKLATTKLMRDFLSRKEAQEISHYPEDWIVDALGQQKLLENVLLVLDWRSAVELKASKRRKPTKSAVTQRAYSSHGLLSRPQLSDLTYKQVKLDVVGESFYPDNFRLVLEEIGGQYKSLCDSSLDLVLDPHNPFSSSGKAVAVCYEGLTLGYVPEKIAPAVHSIVEESDGRASVEGEIWFAARQGEHRRNSVRIVTQRPSFTRAVSNSGPAAHPVRDGQSQAEIDAMAWEESHGKSDPTQPRYVGGSTPRDAGGRPAKKLRISPTPFKMSFYCEKCGQNAESRSRPCAGCNSLRGIPRSAAKTLSASRGKLLEKRALARKQKRAEKLRELAEGSE